MYVDYTGIDTLTLECVSRFKRLSYHKTCSNDCYIIAVTELYTLAKFKLICVLIVEDRSGKSAESHIGRSYIVCHSEYSRLSLNIIGRVDYRHTGYCAHKCYILVALVCRTVLTNGNTCVCCADFNVQMRIAYTVSEYFISSACRKHSKCACEYKLACSSDTCGNAHHICFCYTAVKEAVGICLLEYTCLCCSRKVCV